MSDISSSFLPVSAVVDNLQDYEGFRYRVLEGSATTLKATPTNPANAVQFLNCSPCPLKLTYTLQPPTAKGGIPPKPVTKEIVYKVGEGNTVKFDKAIITEVQVQEAAEAPTNAMTPDLGSDVNANASLDLEAHLRFLNC